MQDDARFGLDRKIRLMGPVQLDSGVQFAPLDFAYETYGTLNEDASNAVLITSPDQKAGLVGVYGGAGQADRYRPLLRDLHQCIGQLLGFIWASE
jgi:hypothetical protein